ncbi:hypothetical protein LSAT2_012277 [Lamellibrachia satsuma]|nr:hypothetical protein LSAT2_012277 [Lamellibrachia satsuma]
MMGNWSKNTTYRLEVELSIENGTPISSHLGSQQQLGTMQTTTVLTPEGQATTVVPMQNVVIAPNYVATPIWTNYASKTSFILGLIQITVGILCIVFNMTAITVLPSVGPGLWGSLFVILTGAFGVMAARQKMSCTVISFMVLSVLASSVYVLPLLVLSTIDLSTNGNYHRDRNTTVALLILLLILSLFEIVIAIWLAVLGCKTVCCGRRSQSGIVMQPVPVVMEEGSPQVIHTAGTPVTNSPTGQMGQQQVYPAPVSQPQQPIYNCPPRYEGASAPPPYVLTEPSGGAEPSATTPLYRGEEKKMPL